MPAYIRTADDENVMEMALIENIQREAYHLPQHLEVREVPVDD